MHDYKISGHPSGDSLNLEGRKNKGREAAILHARKIMGLFHQSTKKKYP